MGRVFISHSTPDDFFVNKLVIDLRKENITTFVDHQDITGGENWNQEIGKALDESTHMIVVCSPDSVVSKNCEIEWLKFLSDKKVVIPILHRPVERKDMPHEFINIQYIDFHDQSVYHERFKQLSMAIQGKVSLESDKPKGKTKDKDVSKPSDDDSLPSTTYLLFPLKRRAKKYIGIATGNIADIKDIDVLVNSENCDLKMARPTDKSISGALNRLSANRDKNGKRVSYPVEKALEKKKEKFIGDVPGGTVVVTTPGSLSRNNVKYILHAVAVEPNEDEKNSRSFKPFSRILLGRCVTNVLKEIDNLNRKKHKTDPLTRVVMPLFGTGDGGLDISEIAPRLIECAIDYLESHDTKVNEVYFVTYRKNQLNDLETVLKNLSDLDEPEESEKDQAGIWMQ